MIFFNSHSAMAAQECTNGPNWELFIHCCLAPSLLITLILSFFGKRYNYRLRSLFGIKYLAVVFPINLLDDHEHRWSHALAFGATASIILTLFSGDYTALYYLKDDNPEAWVKILLGAVATFELGTVLFPFFACITSPSLFVGSLLGFMYVAVWFSVMLSEIITCPNKETGGFPYEAVILQLPVIIFTFLLMIRFFYYLIKSIKKKVKGTKLTSDEKLMKSYQAQHVIALLRPPVLQVPRSQYKKRWERFVYRWYVPSQYFVYPTRIICTFVVAVLCEYEIAIQLSYGFDQFLGSTFNSIREWYSVYVITFNITEVTADDTYVAIDRYETAAHVSWYVACTLSIILSLSYIAHIFVCFRKHVLRLYKGDRKFLPDTPQTSAKSMTGSLQYCGFQIAYYLSGYVIMTLMAFIVIYIISGALIIPLIDDALSTVIGFFNVVVPLLLVIFLVFGSQPILARKVFLQPKLDQNDKDKPLALQHRDFYHTFSYFLVFLNVLVGLMSCVIRILTGLFIGVFLLCRIDRPILMRGYENLDQSYQAYIGNLNMINAHSHPVLVVFCQILVNRIMVRKKAKLARNKSGTMEAAASYAFVEHDVESISPHSRAVMRWQLAYTLLFNPSLLHSRKRSRRITFEELEQRILKVATLLPHRQQVLQRSQAAVAAAGGRVRSGPVFYPKVDDKKAAELLNRELMADRSDYEEQDGADDVNVEVVNEELMKNGLVKKKHGDEALNEPQNLRSFGLFISSDNENEVDGDDDDRNDGNIEHRDLAGKSDIPIPINSRRISGEPGEASTENAVQSRRAGDVPSGNRASSEREDGGGNGVGQSGVDYEHVVIHLDVPQQSSTDDPRSTDSSIS